MTPNMMACLSLVLLTFLLPPATTDSVHDHDPHAEYAFAKCEFIQYLPPIDDESVQPPPMKPIGPLFVSGIQQGAPVAGAPVDEATPAGFIPAHFISMRMRQRIGKKYGESFPLEIFMVGFLGKLGSGQIQNIGLHVREYGVDSALEGCEAAGEDYNPLKTTHGNIWDHPKKRHVGDWGNVRAYAIDGELFTNARFNDYLASILPGEDGGLSILGKSVVLFAREDDLGKKKSDQSKADGSVGPPIVCCSVRMSDGSEFPSDEDVVAPPLP